MRRVLWWYILAGIIFTTSAFGGVLYSPKELWVVGQEWMTTQVMWQRERAAYQERMQAIEKSDMPDTHKEFMRRQEYRRHKATSDKLALQRDRIQNVVVEEANARARRRPSSPDAPDTGHPSSGLRDTAGTRVGDDGHAGMVGDRDMGGGERTTKKVKDVLEDMGLYRPDSPGDSPLNVRETAGTLEIGDDFELTINKTGVKARPGTEFHRIKAEVDARNPETYLSESMKVRNEAGDVVRKDVGADYCETQDHLKKARKGHVLDGDGLVTDPGKMQNMAKGTAKTLEMGNVPDETLAKILKQRGIADSPKAFREKLWRVKERTQTITDPVEAERIRQASQDVFNAAEKEVFARTKRDIVDLRKKASELPPGSPERARIEDEIVDSVTKMKATKSANDELLAAGRSRRSAPEVDASGPKTGAVGQNTYKRGQAGLDGPDAPKRVNVDAELESMEKVYGQADEGLGKKAFGVVTDIADIGQSCQALEDYVDGKATLTDFALTLTDQYVTGGLIGTGKHAVGAVQTRDEARSAIHKANHTNMQAYLLQWEAQFRKAGMSRVDARRVIQRAVLSGNVDHLRDKGLALQAKGAKINPPKLVVETFDTSDEFTVGAYAQRTGNVIYGFGEGIVTGAWYIVRAPSRTIEAWAEGELREAELAEYAAKQKSEARPAMFRKLVDAGVDSMRARDAINAWDEGKTAPLKAVFAEARANIKARQPSPEQIAAAKAEADRIAAQHAKESALIKRYGLLMNYLRWAPTKLTQNPMPVEIAEEGLSETLTLELLLGKPGQLDAIVKEIKGILTQLTGATPTVNVRHGFTCKGVAGARPGLWRTQSPKIPGVYPVTGKVTVSVSGAGLDGPFAMLRKTVRREAFLGVDISLNPDKMDLHGKIWATLRRTPEIIVSLPWQDFRATVKPSGIIRFPTKHTFKTENDTFITREGDVTVRMTSDGAYVREVFIQLDCQTSETPDGAAFNEWKTRYKFQNLALWRHVPITEIQDGEVSYHIKAKDDEEVGFWQEAHKDENGHFKWQRQQTILGNTPGQSCSVLFLMAEKERDAIWAREAAVHKQKMNQQQTAKADAASGGAQYAGPFGKKEGFEGTVTIDVSLKKKTVAAKFRTERILGEDRKAMITGEWIGTIDPSTGEINAKITKGSMGTWVKRDKSWWPPPPYAEESFSPDMKVVGTLKGGAVTGHFEMGENKAFAFEATRVKAKKKTK